MNRRPAYEEIEISHDGNTVRLRPSLRAATILADRHGFPTLFKALDEFDLSIISEIILTVSSSRQDAAAFLFSQAGKPLLPFFLAVREPLAELVGMFLPAPDPKAKPSTSGATTTPSEMYATLYDRATGWLAWTPETTWRATPTEINRAYAAHIERHFPTGKEHQQRQPDPEQAQRNVEAGLDPEFDRSGLEALRSNIKRHGR